MANGGAFVPNSSYSTPTIESTIILKTEQAKRVFNRCFEGASRALFTIDVIARALADTNKSFDHGQVMEAINKMLNDLEREIVNASGRYETMLKAKGHENTRCAYTKEATLKFSISTPEILRFATILSAFDEMIVLFDTCWLCQLVDSKVAQATRTEKLRMIMRIVRKIQLQATTARKGLQRTNPSNEVIAAIGDAIGETQAERESLEETGKVVTGEEESAAA